MNKASSIREGGRVKKEVLRRIDAIGPGPYHGRMETPNELSIHICFSTSRDPRAALVRWFTGSRFSHAFLTYHCGTLGQEMVMEATLKGFNVIPWSRWKRTNRLIDRYALVSLPEEKRKALQELSTKLGQDYDMQGALAFFWRSLGIRLSFLRPSRRRLFCSKAVAEFLHRAEVPHFEKMGRFSPEDIFQRIQKMPTYFEQRVEGDARR